MRLLRETLVELRAVEADVLRVLLELVLLQRGLIVEELGVVLPELALRVGARGGLRRGPRHRMHRQRVVAKDEPHLVAVRRHHFVHRVLGALAERTLVIRELDDRDRRLHTAAALGTAGGRDVDHGRLEGDGRLVLRLQLVDELPEPLLPALPLQVLDDLRLHLVERLAFQLRLVVVVDFLNLLVGRHRDLVGDLGLPERVDRHVTILRLLLDELVGDHLVGAVAECFVSLIVELDQLRAHLVLELATSDLLRPDGRDDVRRRAGQVRRRRLLRRTRGAGDAHDRRHAHRQDGCNCYTHGTSFHKESKVTAPVPAGQAVRFAAPARAW